LIIEPGKPSSKSITLSTCYVSLD